MESANMLVVLKFDDGSEWQGRIPEPVERYMAGMADEIQTLRDEVARLRDALLLCLDINGDGATMRRIEMIANAALDAARAFAAGGTHE